MRDEEEIGIEQAWDQYRRKRRLSVRKGSVSLEGSQGSCETEPRLYSKDVLKDANEKYSKEETIYAADLGMQDLISSSKANCPAAQIISMSTYRKGI